MAQPPRSGDTTTTSDSTHTAQPAAPSLAARLRERIGREGATMFREWMRAALYDEREGYYRRHERARWGREGDYRTSPERSRLFAATFARYFASLFEEHGRSRQFHILEKGGGAGHFAGGVLSTLERDAPHVFSHLRYVFDESSADARAQAAKLLAPFSERVEFQSLDELDTPRDFGIIFSNELLDALPVHRVVMRDGMLLELYVGLSGEGDFVWVEREPSTPLLSEHFKSAGITLAEGQYAEVNLEAEAFIRRAVGALSRGYVVTVDYGDEAGNLFGAPHRRAGTLRAFRQHSFAADVLDSPGEQDLTTTVNWTQLLIAGRRAGLDLVSLERQDTFLLRTGLLEQLELESLAAHVESEIVRLRLDAREMILPGGMGEHFQVLVQKKVGTT